MKKITLKYFFFHFLILVITYALLNFTFLFERERAMIERKDWVFLFFI